MPSVSSVRTVGVSLAVVMMMFPFFSSLPSR
jgi:hypothetical protein